MHPRLRAGDRAVGAAVLDRHAVDEHPVERAVALDQRRRVGPGQLAEGVVERLGREVGVEPAERVAQPPLQDDVAVAGLDRSAPAAPEAISGPWRTAQPRPSSQARAASSTIDSVKPVDVKRRTAGTSSLEGRRRRPSEGTTRRVQAFTIGRNRSCIVCSAVGHPGVQLGHVAGSVWRTLALDDDLALLGLRHQPPRRPRPSGAARASTSADAAARSGGSGPWRPGR